MADPFFDPASPTVVAAPDAIAYVDGAVEPVNPGGTAGWGFTIRDYSGVLLQEGYGRMAPKPEMTNNVAEYVAAGMALKTYRELGRPGPLLIRGDSKLVIMQIRRDRARCPKTAFAACRARRAGPPFPDSCAR